MKYNAKQLDKSTNAQTIYVDKDNLITVDQGIMYVKSCNTVRATPERVANGAIDISKNSISTNSSGFTPINDYSYVAYGAIAGQELWEIHQEAQFTYNGKGASANYKKGYSKDEFCSIWQVSNWEDSQESKIYDENVWKSRVMSSGNFHFGIEVQGIGLVVQDEFCWIDARCTYNGRTSGYYGFS